MNNNIVDIYDCFAYDQKINFVWGEKAKYCNYCRQTCGSSMRTILTTGPKILIIILNRGKGIDFNECKISDCVSEAFTQGEDMLMKFKEKITSKGKAVLYLIYLDNGRYFPLLKVFDADENLILEKDLPESQTLDNFGQISLTSKKVTISPRKNSRTEFYEKIEYVL